MELIIRHQFRDLQNYYVTTFFQNLYEAIKLKFPQHSFTVLNDPSYENMGYGSIYSCMNFSIINPATDKYILISFFDNWKYHFMKHLGWNPNKMVQFFYPGGFNYIDYFNFKFKEQKNPDIECPSTIDSIYQSFFYGPYESGSLDDIDTIFKSRNIHTSIPTLYFRGYVWDFRKQMIEHIKDKSILILDKNIDNNNLNYIDYLKDLSTSRAALSLPGGTEICNRDIECFAVGVPVIRPYLDISYPEPLISNYHYINCYIDCKYWDGHPSYLCYSDFAKSLEYYWNQVKENTEYLNFISSNARKWFVKNCILKKNIKYILTQIDLGSLYG